MRIDPEPVERPTLERRRAIAVWVVAASIPLLALAAAWVTDRQVAADTACRGGAVYASCGVSPAFAAGVVVVGGLVALVLTAAAHRWSSSPVLAWIVAGLWLVAAGVYLALPPSG